MNKTAIIISLSILLFVTSCRTSTNDDNLKQPKRTNYITDFSAKNDDNTINVVIEIPAGTNEKWEVNKQNGEIEWEKRDGDFRMVKYLAYPANYGMIPRTKLPKELGGDGDPLDVLLLGESISRGEVVKAKVIGVLNLLDGGEQDDKLIAVQASGSYFSHLQSIEQLEDEYEGITQIIELWFSNYKGKGKLVANGFSEKDEANKILEFAIEEYEK